MNTYYNATSTIKHNEATRRAGFAQPQANYTFGSIFTRNHGKSHAFNFGDSGYEYRNHGHKHSHSHSHRNERYDRHDRYARYEGGGCNKKSSGGFLKALLPFGLGVAGALFLPKAFPAIGKFFSGLFHKTEKPVVDSEIRRPDRNNIKDLSDAYTERNFA